MNIKYPAGWKKKTFKETRFRGDYGEIKSSYTQPTKKGLAITEDENYVNGYRQAIKDVRTLNKQ